MSRDINIGEFMKLTNAGLNIATYSEIRAALIKRYKNIYGSDIDVSTASADGVFVSDLALIINNILQTSKSFYSNLDVNTATGIYLDALCRLANVERKGATASSAGLKVRNIGSVDITLTKNTEFVDKAGTIWVYKDDDIVLPHNSIEYTSITVLCEELGAVKADPGWITSTVETTTLDVVQQNAAIVGQNIESDSALRARRNQSSGAAGTTVLENLVGALLNIEGIDDVLVYNNNSDAAILAADGTNIPAHSVYVVIRQDPGVSIADSVIGNVIYNKLTPGISTVRSASSTAKSYLYTPVVFGETIRLIEQNVYWKKAEPIAPTIRFKLTPLPYFAASEIDQIGSSILTYMNDRRLGKDVSTQDLLIQILNADPKFKNEVTYSIGLSDITISTSINNDTYYHYDTINSYLDSGKWVIELN